MKRKRFIKLLMANGADRNEANRIAGEIPAAVPYASAFHRVVWSVMVGSFAMAAKDVANAFTAMGWAFSQPTFFIADEKSPFGRKEYEEWLKIKRGWREC